MSREPVVVAADLSGTAIFGSHWFSREEGVFGDRFRIYTGHDILLYESISDDNQEAGPVAGFLVWEEDTFFDSMNSFKIKA